MMKSLFVAAAALVFAASAVPAHASHGGGFGLGLLSNDFPAGVFFGLNDNAMVHFGLDFQKPDTDDADNGEAKFGFGVLGALEYDIWSGDNWGFGLFPCVSFYTVSYEDVGATSVDSESDFNIGLNLGGHFDPVDQVSVYFKHGVNIDIYTPPGGGDSETSFGTEGWDLGEFGVAFWVK